MEEANPALCLLHHNETELKWVEFESYIEIFFYIFRIFNDAWESSSQLSYARYNANVRGGDDKLYHLK